MKKMTYTSHVALTAAVVFVCVHLPGNSLASRPFITEDAGTAGKGVMQCELSWDHLTWRNDNAEHVLSVVPIVGITEEIELSLEAPFLFHAHPGEHTTTGVGDVSIAGKYLVKREDKLLPAFAVKTIVKTTTGNAGRGLGSGAIDYGMAGVASKHLGEFTLHGIIGYTFIGANGDPNVRDIFFHGIAGEYALTEDIHLVAEVAGNRHPDRTIHDHPKAAMLGAIFTVSDRMILDAAARYGMNSVTPDWNTSVGLTLNL